MIVFLMPDGSGQIPWLSKDETGEDVDVAKTVPYSYSGEEELYQIQYNPRLVSN